MINTFCKHQLPCTVVRHNFVARAGTHVGNMQQTAASLRQGLAAEYHTTDFSWAEHAKEAAPLVAEQERLSKLLTANPDQADGIQGAPTVSNGHSQASSKPPKRTHRRKSINGQASTTPQAADSCLTGSALQGEIRNASNDEVYEGQKWEDFYASTARSAKFFKERRYLLLEFPVLAQTGPLHVVELGCGYGASLLPILRHNPEATVVATDIAPTCVAQLTEVAKREKIDNYKQRITAFVADSASDESRPLFEGVNADVALIMFTLSAVPPEGQAAMLANAIAALRPGGVLCIRDHGLYDMVQLRIPAEQWVGPNMYKRGDGTLAYFFSIQDLSEKAEAAGFRVKECDYVTVYNINRRTGLQLKRVFIHGVFQKP